MTAGLYARAFMSRTGGKIDPLVHTMLAVGAIGYYVSFPHIISTCSDCIQYIFRLLSFKTKQAWGTWVVEIECVVCIWCILHCTYLACLILQT